MTEKETEELKKANETLKINIKYEVETLKQSLLKIIEKHEKDYSLIKEYDKVDFYQVFIDNLIYDLKTILK